jgi:prepilin-type N-terminal cleavage/methylation domain-containing protein
MTARSTGHPRRTRRGMSLIELVITLVLVSIIGAASGKLLVSQTRYFARMSAKKDARSVTRNARNLIQSELSMVEASGGVVAANNDSITVRMPYAWGVFCSSATIAHLPGDSAMYAMATMAGYAIKPFTSTGVYTYTASATVPTAGTAANCTGLAQPITAPTNGDYLSVTGLTGTAGAPVFLWQQVTYKFAASTLFPGTRGLYRRVGTGSSGTAEEILAPFESTAQFNYYSLNSATSTSTTPALTDIRGVELKLDAQSPNRASNRSSAETSRITTAIFFRNRVD